MLNLGIHEIHHLRNDVEYSDKLESLQDAYDEIEFILNEVRGEN